MMISVLNMQEQIREAGSGRLCVGGLAVGETHEEMYHILDVTVPHLPADKPVYSDGCGNTGKYSGSRGQGCGFL